MIARRSDRHSDPIATSIDGSNYWYLFPDNDLYYIPHVGEWGLKYGTELIGADDLDTVDFCGEISQLYVKPYTKGMVLTLTQE